MSNIFRVFVSSTFSDMVAERNALQKQVFPRLRDWCRTQGVTFQAIDLRWGISQEAGLNQRATDVCLNEISRCQASTKRPNFLLLMGDRYGWRPLPDDIPAGEWDTFFPHITDSDDQDLLNLWYKRDDNAVPPLYVLQKRTGDFVDYPRWAEVENRLQAILWDAIRGLNWDDRTRMKYETSVTEQEIQAGIFDYADEGAICFFRRIHNLPDDAEKYRDIKEGAIDTHAQARLTALKNRIRAHIPNGVHEYDATWRGDAPDIDLKAFCERVYAVLQRAIEAEIATQQSLTPQQIEQNAHDVFRKERGRLVIGRDDVLNRVGAYLHSDSQTPLVLYGQSGVGKSSIMACAIPDDAIYRFIGVTPQSSDIRQVVYGLCEHIATRYGISETIPQDYEELIEAFPKFLASATADKPLVLFLDALDQLSNTNAPYNLRWLPKDLPPHVKLVLSVIPSKYLTALQRQLPAENLIEIPPLAQGDADTLLNRWLVEVHRTVQPHQRHEIMTKFAHTGLPLYLKLAFEEAKLWRSYDAITPLHDDVPSLIRYNLFGRLSDKAEHGDLLVNRSLAYLRASRNGLTEDEILDLLTADKVYWDDFYAKSFHKEALDVIGGVPIVVWSRLYFDLAPYMTQRSADGTALWAFFHRQFNEVVDVTYLSDDVRPDRHAHLANYFMGQELYLGDIPNARKVSEQAYQQAMAGMQDEYVATLTTYQFLQASLDVNGVLALIEDCGLMDDQIVRLIQSALSMSAHVLVNDKRALAHQLAGRLMHHYTKVDEIRTFLDVVMTTPNNLFPTNLASAYSIMNTAGGALIRTMKHQDSINCAYILANGRILSWGDGAIYLWDENGNFLKYLRVNTSWDRVLGVRGLSDGRILSWGYDDNIWLWDSEGNLLVRLRDQSISEGEYSAQVGDVQLLPNGNLLSWCKNKRFLALWDKNGSLIKTIDGYDENICGAKLLPNGCILAWSDKTAKIWDLDGNFIAIPQIPPNPAGILSGVEILDDGYIVLWQEVLSSRTWIWDSNCQPIAKIETGNGEIYGVKSWSSGIFLSWSNYGRKNMLKLWNYKGQVVRIFSEHSGTIRGVIVLPNQQILSWNDGYFRENDSHRIKLWNSDGELVKTLSGHAGKVNGVLISPNNLVLSWGDDKTLRLWDIGKEIITDRTRHNTKINHVLILTNKQIISCSDDNTLRLWDLDGNLLATMDGHTSSVINAIELSDGNILSWSYDNKLRLWDRTGASLAVFEGHYSEIWWARELEDGRIVSGSNDETSRLWDRNGSLISTLDEEYYGNKKAFLNWASKHQFDGNVVYSKEESKYKDYFKITDDRFEIFRSQGYSQSQRIYTFYGDALFTAFDASEDIIVVGDNIGRVMFLRWVGEDGS